MLMSRLAFEAERISCVRVPGISPMLSVQGSSVLLEGT